MKKIVIEYRDFIIKSNVKSNLFSLYRKIARKKKNSDEVYEALIDIKLSTTLITCVENIVTILVSEQLPDKASKLGEVVKMLIDERKQIQDYFGDLMDSVYNYNNINTFYFNSELELISFKAYLGKKIIVNSEIIYEGLETDIKEDLDCYNKTFLSKEDIYATNRYILICRLKNKSYV